MAGAVVALPKDSGSTASFRLWGGGISAQLTALGFTKTADTGQIDWTTVTASAGGSAWVAGYEVRAFTDDLQPTRPIVAKIEYGSTTTTGTNPGLYITVGTASNGSGTISSHASWPNTTQARTNITTNVTNGTTATTNCFFGNADGSAIGALLWPSNGDSTIGGQFFGIERMRNADGTPNGDGFCVWTARSGASGIVAWQQFLYNASINQAAEQNHVMAPWAPGWSGAPGTLLVDTTLYPLPVFTGLSPKLQGPSQLLVSLGRNDMTGGTQFSMSHYGTTSTWAAAGQGSSSNTGWGVWATNASNTTSSAATVFPSSFAMRIS